jgi:hypothetical protein
MDVVYVKSIENFRNLMISSEQEKVDIFLLGHSIKMLLIAMRWYDWSHADLQVHAENMISIGCEPF